MDHLPKRHNIVRCPAHDKSAYQDPGNLDSLYLSSSYNTLAAGCYTSYLVIFSHLLEQSRPSVDDDDDGQVAPHHHYEREEPGECEYKDEVKQLLAKQINSLSCGFSPIEYYR